MNLVDAYKKFWSDVENVASDHGVTGFFVTFSGAGDDGSIDELQAITGIRPGRMTDEQIAIEEEIDTDQFGNSMKPHPWSHLDEDFQDLEGLNITMTGVEQEREVFVEGEGWKTSRVVADFPLIEMVKRLACEVAYIWFPGWETNSGSSGTLYFYPEDVEFEFTEYYEEGKEQGHRCYSETVPVDELHSLHTDLGYRGKCVDAINEDWDEDDDA